VDVLVVSADLSPTEKTLIECVLAEHNVGTKIADSYRKAVEDLARHKYSIVILYHFNGKEDLKTTAAIRIMKQIVRDLLIVAVSEEKTLDTERELREFGLYYYLTRPFAEKELKEVLSSALRKKCHR